MTVSTAAGGACAFGGFGQIGKIGAVLAAEEEAGGINDGAAAGAAAGLFSANAGKLDELAAAGELAGLGGGVAAWACAAAGSPAACVGTSAMVWHLGHLARLPANFSSTRKRA